jgi:hypothetical protein
VPINEAAVSSHTVRQGDTINIIPFVVDNTNAVQKGLTLKYISTSGALTISIHFQRVHEADRIKPHFRLWGIPLEDDSIAHGQLQSYGNNSLPHHNQPFVTN